jgi:hypothetical protein
MIEMMKMLALWRYRSLGRFEKRKLQIDFVGIR